MSFREFMQYLRLPLFAAFAAFLLGSMCGIGGYIVRYTRITNNIAFYHKFLPAMTAGENPTSKTADKNKERNEEPTFVQHIDTLLSAKAGLSYIAVHSLKELLSTYKSDFEKYASLLRNNVDEAYILVSQKERIPELIHSAELKRSKLSANLLILFRPAIYIWMLSPFMFILIWATNGKNHILYFPIRKWWLYAYLILSLPVSVLLVAVVTIREIVFYITHSNITWKNRFNKRVEYADKCSEISGKRNKYRQGWIELVSEKRSNTRMDQITKRLKKLHSSLQQASRDLFERQQEYFTLKKALDIPAISTEIRERLEREFDQLFSNPNIMAVAVEDDALQVYTNSFPHPFVQRVGPFQITINLLSTKWGIHAAHETTRAHPIGGGLNGSFCFGNVSGLIENLLAEYRICEAVGLMLEAFQNDQRLSE